MSAVSGVDDPLGRDLDEVPIPALCDVCRSGAHHCADGFCPCPCVYEGEDA